MVNGTLNPSGVLLGTVTEIWYTPICPATSPAKVTGSPTPLSEPWVHCQRIRATQSRSTTGDVIPTGRVNVQRIVAAHSSSGHQQPSRPDRWPAGCGLPACPFRSGGALGRTLAETGPHSAEWMLCWPPVLSSVRVNRREETISGRWAVRSQDAAVAQHSGERVVEEATGDAGLRANRVNPPEAIRSASIALFTLEMSGCGSGHRSSLRAGDPLRQADKRIWKGNTARLRMKFPWTNWNRQESAYGRVGRMAPPV